MVFEYGNLQTLWDNHKRKGEPTKWDEGSIYFLQNAENIGIGRATNYAIEIPLDIISKCINLVKMCATLDCNPFHTFIQENCTNDPSGPDWKGGWELCPLKHIGYNLGGSLNCFRVPKTQGKLNALEALRVINEEETHFTS